ncbi:MULTISPECIES: VOC family protein [unclassified Lysinibacillus]|uniref:VOC family protein n=1 Tax=unclassified Lysinibacillus TaxID=2636778 RepID=UPI002010E946|nr:MULTISPECIES: VOC family protein [unclassified Lysinibacillus]MCL1694738.1 VOC family protein [Lysinibacillus sp. BPa_S21]MCL1699591.1 VOC family protein [Lysinibacillus sp. Bpr_S20]
MTKKYVHHICIQTNTYAESLHFYTEVLGFELVQESPNFHNRHFNTWLKLGDFYIELQTGKYNEDLDHYNPNAHGIVHFCLWVDNLRQEVERLKAMNVNFICKNDEIIYKVENGQLCKLTAPEGTIIEFRDNKGV